MFCAPNAKILTEVSEKSFLRKIRFVVFGAMVGDKCILEKAFLVRLPGA